MEIQNKKKKLGRPKSLKSKLLVYVLISWLIPMLIFTIFSVTSYRRAYVDKIEKLIQNGMKNSTMLVDSRLDEAIRLIQKPTYEKDWEKAWIAYRKKRSDANDFYNVITTSLKTKYYSDERFNLYAFYLEGSNTPKIYSSRVGFGYNQYMDLVQPELNQIIGEDNNYVQVKVIHNQLYLIRNLYTVSNYTKYGTLVVALNSKALFDGFPMEEANSVAICFQKSPELLFLNEEEKDQSEYAAQIYQSLQEKIDVRVNEKAIAIENRKYKGYMYENKMDNYQVSLLYAVNESLVYESLYELYRLLLYVMLLFIPLIWYTFHYLKKQIEIPVEKLVEVSKTITEGNIGTIVEGPEMPNAEFEYLVKSFNKMSEQVKYLFDSVYNEKLARKDAQIAALQAQINPHFLNNTLEMMNWQARMSNDIIVCKMIEALGTVLDHSMNRDNQKEIYLSEELRCADAYLYIMSMRFGQRMQVKRDVDESLLWIYVPQLILQPIIENAILHGIERVKAGVIHIKIHHDESNTYLDVINTGKPLTKEKLEEIRGILDGDESTIAEGSGKHTSIGIRNVNKRIKLVYGEEYGLVVEGLSEDKFLSRIVIPYVQNHKNEQIMSIQSNAFSQSNTYN